MEDKSPENLSQMECIVDGKPVKLIYPNDLNALQAKLALCYFVKVVGVIEEQKSQVPDVKAEDKIIDISESIDG